MSNVTVLRIIFEGFNIGTKSYGTCVIMASEDIFCRSWMYKTICTHNYIVCSDIKIDSLIRHLCEVEGGEFWEAYKTAELSGYFYNDFPEPNFSNRYQYGILRFSELNFEKLINQLGGVKIAETTTKTPDFLVGDAVVELKDLQNESMYDEGRRKAIAKIFEDDLNYSIGVNFSTIEDKYSLSYKRLIANSIKNIIKKASTQIKEYSKTNNVASAGVILLNTGYFSLNHALFKTLVEDILNRETNTIKFAYVFTQSVLHNVVGDLRSDYQQDFIGTIPTNIEPLQQAVLELIERKMSSIFQPDIGRNSFIPPQQLISFFEDGKIFYWKPERLKPSIRL